jgi:cell division protein FtsQ
VSSVFLINYRVKEVSVTFNNGLYSESEILNMLDISIGELIIFNNPFVIHSKMNKFSFIKDIDVSITIGGKINIFVHFKEPLFAVISDKNYLFIGENNEILKIGNNDIGLFSVSGFDVINPKVGSKITTSNQIELTNISSLIKLLTISKFEYLPKIEFENQNIKLYLDEFYIVVFGDGSNIEDKFNNFINIFYELEKKNTNKGIINVSNDGLPTYKPFIN